MRWRKLYVSNNTRMLDTLYTMISQLTTTTIKPCQNCCLLQRKPGQCNEDSGAHESTAAAILPSIMSTCIGTTRRFYRRVFCTISLQLVGWSQPYYIRSSFTFRVSINCWVVWWPQQISPKLYCKEAKRCSVLSLNFYSGFELYYIFVYGVCVCPGGRRGLNGRPLERFWSEFLIILVYIDGFWWATHAPAHWKQYCEILFCLSRAFDWEEATIENRHLTRVIASYSSYCFW